MATKLKPLKLSQMVEDNASTRAPRKNDDDQIMADAPERGHSAAMFLSDNASVSDITSPVTPTFSNCSGLGHLPYSSSTSSLDLPLSLPSPCYSECTSTPSAVPSLGKLSTTTLTNPGGAPAPKRVLPDVQEDSYEQTIENENLDSYHEDQHKVKSTEDLEAMILAHRISDSYGCLCDEPCTHGRANQYPVSFNDQRFDYDMGFASDNDISSPYTSRPRRRANGASMSALSDAGKELFFSSLLTQRIGSPMNVLSRWRSASTSSRRAYGNSTTAPVSDPSLTHAPSSRSSSLSAGRPALADLFNPIPNTTPVVLTPPHHHYGSTDSIEQFPSTTGAMHEDEINDVRKSIERVRTKATTPLLPPLFINTPHPLTSLLPSPSVYTSPHKVANYISPLPAAHSPISFQPCSPITAATPTEEVLPSPPLSCELASDSFRYALMGSKSAVASPLEPQDEWADRLGHANQTISPRPYHLPNGASTVQLNQLCEDWAQARTNYAKHLMRMGEHYGSTSNIFVLTKAKWSETECQWKAAHDEAVSRMVPHQECVYAQSVSQHKDISAAIPQIVDTEGKFPHRGDDEIVGPMVRIERDDVPPVEDNGMSKFLRGLAGRVLMRRSTSRS